MNLIFLKFSFIIILGKKLKKLSKILRKSKNFNLNIITTNIFINKLL